MIPLKDTIPSRTRPIVNYFLIIITCVVFYLQMTAGVRDNFLVDRYAFIPKELYLFLIGDLYSLNPFQRMFTSMFLHGGLLHLIGNMLYLYIFGDNVEDRLGHFKYLIFYIISGLVAAFFHYLFNPLSSIPTLGASGAVAGVMGAYFIFFSTFESFNINTYLHFFSNYRNTCVFFPVILVSHATYVWVSKSFCRYSEYCLVGSHRRICFWNSSCNFI